ncbi:MAG: hypothetical protein AB7I41_05140 [Candidatus Sericytochromatia bacterium]
MTIRFATPWMLGALTLVSLAACRGQHADGNQPKAEIYILKNLPANLSCTKIASEALTDGNGCGQMDSGTSPAYLERLHYNLRKRAEQVGANLVVTHNLQAGEYREGCARNQIEVTFSLYRCPMRQIAPTPKP